jgi:hypothetical protein
MLTIPTGLTDITRLRFSADSRFLVVEGDTADAEGYEVWRVPPKKRPAPRASGVVLRGVEWSPGKAELYIPRNPALDVITPTGRPIQSLPDVGWVTGLAFSPAGDRMLTYSPFTMVGWQRHREGWRAEWSVKTPTISPRRSDQFETAVPFPDGGRVMTPS